MPREEQGAVARGAHSSRHGSPVITVRVQQQVDHAVEQGPSHDRSDAIAAIETRSRNLSSVRWSIKVIVPSGPGSERRRRRSGMSFIIGSRSLGRWAVGRRSAAPALGSGSTSVPTLIPTLAAGSATPGPPGRRRPPGGLRRAGSIDPERPLHLLLGAPKLGEAPAERARDLAHLARGSGSAAPAGRRPPRAAVAADHHRERPGTSYPVSAPSRRRSAARRRGSG